MNLILKCISLVLLVTTFVSFGKALEADFSDTLAIPTAGHAVQFTNQSFHARSFSWNFGAITIGIETNGRGQYVNFNVTYP
jgi:PKD repeat protein